MTPEDLIFNTIKEIGIKNTLLVLSQFVLYCFYYANVKDKKRQIEYLRQDLAWYKKLFKEDIQKWREA